MSIVAKELTKQYGQQIAANKVSFSINKGEIVGFLGPNGAGKSTTMKMITGYLTPTSGEVSVCGITVNDSTNNYKQHIGYLPESNPQYIDMYVVEYLEFLCRLHRIKNSSIRIKEVIGLTGLGVEQHKKIGALSKGYKQRVGIAQALIHNPEVLILDEPTSGLDPNQVLDIRALIKELGSTKTILLSSHIMQEVEAMCERIILINKGNIVADNSLQDIKMLNKNKQEVQIILSTKQVIPVDAVKQLSAIVTNVDFINNNKVIITTTQADLVKKELLKLAIDNNLDVDSLQTESQSLEELFRTLTAQQSI
jgi:ABC-2 type transport system ATP-binding protein